MEYLKEYFYNYILKPVSEIVYTQKIYKDFQKVCISKNFYEDSFTMFIEINYYKVMITDLCRLLEKPKHSNDRNFRGVIDEFKKKSSEIFNKRKNCKFVNLKNNFIEYRDISNFIKSDFDSIDHGNKLKELENLFEVFRLYRNKVNCHQTSEQIELPTKKQIDEAVSILNDLLFIYANLFGIHICSVIPNPIYRNPPLKEK